MGLDVARTSDKAARTRGLEASRRSAQAELTSVNSNGGTVTSSSDVSPSAPRYGHDTYPATAAYRHAVSLFNRSLSHVSASPPLT